MSLRSAVWTARSAVFCSTSACLRRSWMMPQRGFSFMQDGPLDMRMNPDAGVSAAQFIASAAEEEIARVFKEYGEERFAKRMARAVVAAPCRAAV